MFSDKFTEKERYNLNNRTLLNKASNMPLYATSLSDSSLLPQLTPELYNKFVGFSQLKKLPIYVEGNVIRLEHNSMWIYHNAEVEEYRIQSMYQINLLSNLVNWREFISRCSLPETLVDDMRIFQYPLSAANLSGFRYDTSGNLKEMFVHTLDFNRDVLPQTDDMTKLLNYVEKNPKYIKAHVGVPVDDDITTVYLDFFYAKDSTDDKGNHVELSTSYISARHLYGMWNMEFITEDEWKWVSDMAESKLSETRISFEFKFDANGNICDRIVELYTHHEFKTYLLTE